MDDKGASCGPGSGSLRSPEPQGVSAHAGDDPSRKELDSWLAANCGRGLPHGEAVDLKGALHGLAYTLRQIESTPTYRPHIGQCVSAVSSLRWALDYIARAELAHGAVRVPRPYVRARSTLERIHHVLSFGGSVEIGTELACEISEVIHVLRDSDGPRMAETNEDSARGEAGPARAEGIAR